MQHRSLTQWTAVRAKVRLGVLYAPASFSHYVYQWLDNILSPELTFTNIHSRWCPEYNWIMRRSCLRPVSTGTQSRLKSIATYEMLWVGLFFSYPSVLGSRICESDTQPTLSDLNRLRAVKAGVLHFFKLVWLIPTERARCNQSWELNIFFVFKYMLQMYLNTKCFQQMC